MYIDKNLDKTQIETKINNTFFSNPIEDINDTKSIITLKIVLEL